MFQLAQPTTFHHKTLGAVIILTSMCVTGLQVTLPYPLIIIVRGRVTEILLYFFFSRFRPHRLQFFLFTLIPPYSAPLPVSLQSPFDSRKGEIVNSWFSWWRIISVYMFFGFLLFHQRPMPPARSIPDINILPPTANTSFHSNIFKI